MKMLNLRRTVRGAIAAAAIAAMAATTGCNAIYDDQGDCSVHYRVSFRYTQNILHADAFGPQVSTVHLYIFDSATGRLALTRSEERALSTDNGFHMEVDLLPGRYDMIAWCEGHAATADATRFTIGGGATPASMAALGATLPLSGTAPALCSDKNIVPLYHGMATGIDFPDTFGTVNIAPIYLTKDTNRIRVLLQNTEEKPLDASLFSFSIQAANSELDYTNALVAGSPEFSYREWSSIPTSASFDKPQLPGGGRGTIEDGDFPTGVLAELTTGRLMADREQYLTVRRTDTGEEIIRIPMIDYLLMVMDEYDFATEQEYLDCWDNYTLMFFVDKGMTWAKTKIYINGWRRVPKQSQDLY